MRSSQAKKQENRQRILDISGRLLREKGIAGVSVADVMQAADMTHGGFYRHFADKDELIACALDEVLQRDSADDSSPQEPVTEDLVSVASRYLTLQHRGAPGDGCPFAALGSEVARAPAGTRRVLTQGIQQQIERLSALSPGRGEDEQRRAAIAHWSAMIGAMVLSRISDDPQLAEEILVQTRAWLAEVSASPDGDTTSPAAA